MLYGYFTTFTLEDFKKLLKEEKYDELIYNCYYCNNQEDILGYLEKHLSMNNFILNYVYIRNNYQQGHFEDRDVLRKCLTLAFRTIYILVCHINLYGDINKRFEVLEIICNKFDEKFRQYVDLEVLKFAVEQSKKDMLNFVDAMSVNINVNGSPLLVNDKKKYLDLPEPYIIFNIKRGSWRYPALKYEVKTQEENQRLNNLFFSNYSGRCQRYYESFQLVNEKLKSLFLYFEKQNEFSLTRMFV